MDKLKKAQKDEFATAFAVLALYDGGVSHDGASAWMEAGSGCSGWLRATVLGGCEMHGLNTFHVGALAPRLDNNLVDACI